MTEKIGRAIVFAMELKWISGQTLAEDELRKIIEIDNEIPRIFDPSWRATKTLAERLEQFKNFNDADFFQVIYADREIVGFHIIKGSKNHIAYLETLWIKPSHQRRGLAKKLKELGVSWAKEKGYESLQTAVHVKNERMYRINILSGYEPLSTVFRMKL